MGLRLQYGLGSDPHAAWYGDHGPSTMGRTRASQAGSIALPTTAPSRWRGWVAVARPGGCKVAMTAPCSPSYAGCRFPIEVIGHAVRLSFRFPLSLRRVEDMPAARGIVVSHETVRQCLAGMQLWRFWLFDVSSGFDG
jgi:hypothetical protein